MAKRIQGLGEWKSTRGMKPAELRRQIATLRKAVSRLVASELVHGLEHRAAMGTIEKATSNSYHMRQTIMELRKALRVVKAELAYQIEWACRVRGLLMFQDEVYSGMNAGLREMMKDIKAFEQIYESKKCKTPSLGRKAQNPTLAGGRKSRIGLTCGRRRFLKVLD